MGCYSPSGPLCDRGRKACEMGLSRAEQETTIRWDREDGVVSVWSADPVVWRRMARLGVRAVRETTLEGKPSGKLYRVERGQFRWGLKRQGGGRGNVEALRAARARSGGAS